MKVMTTIEIYDAINAATSVPELKDVIVKIWGHDGRIMGRSEPFSVSEMLIYIDWFVEDYTYNVANNTKNHYRGLPTRMYGIRQQLCMILLNPSR